MKRFAFVFFFLLPLKGMVLLFLMPLFLAIRHLKCVFSIGQGNFVLLKKDANFLTVDVQSRNGTNRMKDILAAMTINGNARGKLAEKLEYIGMNKADVIHSHLITHDHGDHFCLFQNFWKFEGCSKYRFSRQFNL
jgi:hypothetical protein